MYDSKYPASKKEREVTNPKSRVVSEGDIFPSGTESRELTVSRVVVEQLMPERKRK